MVKRSGIFLLCVFIYVVTLQNGTVAKSLRNKKRMNLLRLGIRNRQKFVSTCKVKSNNNQIECEVVRKNDGKTFREALEDIVSLKGGKCCGQSHFIDYEKLGCENSACCDDEDLEVKNKINMLGYTCKWAGTWNDGEEKYCKCGVIANDDLQTSLDPKYEYCYKVNQERSLWTSPDSLINKIPTCRIILPHGNIKMEWNKNPTIRELTKLSAYFLGGVL